MSSVSCSTVSPMRHMASASHRAATATALVPLAPRTGAAASRRQMGPHKTTLRPLQARPEAAKAAAVVAQGVYEATGVPLVDSLMQMATVDAALQHSLRLVAIAAAGVLVGTLVLRTIDRITGGSLGESGFNPIAVGVASTLKPAAALLPFYGMAYAATVVSALAQVAATKMKGQFNTLCFGHGAEVLSGLKWVTQLVHDTSELVVIVFIAWTAISFKNRVLHWLTHGVLAGRENQMVVQLLSPLSVVLDALIFLSAGFSALNAYGVNVGPLMASVGGIGVAVGLATQSVATNVVSALSLFASRPFVVGDRVQLMKGGAVVVEGKVEHIEPMRTVLRDPEGNPIYISNAEVTGYWVKNLTQGAASKARG